MFYLHLLIGLTGSNKFWRAAKHLVPVLKGVMQVKFYFYEILKKSKWKKKSEFFKNIKTRFWESFDHRGFCVSLRFKLDFWLKTCSYKNFNMNLKLTI